MIETPNGILLKLFQQDRFFWAVEDTERNFVECRFCGARDDRPDTLNHRPYCAIEEAMASIRSDESLLRRVMLSPPRLVWRISTQLTVFKGGDPRRAIEYPGTN